MYECSFCNQTCETGTFINSDRHGYHVNRINYNNELYKYECVICNDCCDETQIEDECLFWDEDVIPYYEEDVDIKTLIKW